MNPKKKSKTAQAPEHKGPPSFNLQLSGVVNRVAIWFYYRKAFATAFAVLSRAQFWLSRRDFFRNIFRGGFRGKYSS